MNEASENGDIAVDTRFAIRTYAGAPHRFFLVEQITVDSPNVVTTTYPAHHIVVVDASGSMWGSMRDMTSMIEKLWTLEEFKDSGQLVSLLSYSSAGDVVEHFSRVPVEDVMSGGSQYISNIRSLRTRGLTCISQALDHATTLCRNGELTCITLHSDGYANHQDPVTERRAIDRAIGNIAGLGDVYVNTIAYGDNCDFVLLNSIANSLSGRGLRAGSIREIYEALHDTTTLLASQRAPALTQQLGTAGYQVFVSKADQKIVGSGGDLTVRGLSVAADKTIYRYREVSEDEYDQSSLPVCGEASPLDPVWAFSRAQVAEGNFNTAKYAIVATRNQTVADNHIRALTGLQIADMVADIEACLFFSTDNHTYSNEYGFESDKINILSLLVTLSRWSGALEVNIEDLRSNYTRRGLARIAGKRDKATGEVEVPWLDTRYVDDGQWVRVVSVDINRNTANANIKVDRKVQLVDRESNEHITKVAGIDVSELTDYRNYTLVGGGGVHVPSLTLRINDKRAHKALVMAGVLGGDYDPTGVYTVELAGRNLVPFDTPFRDIQGVFPELARYRVLLSILNAMTTDTSVSYTSDQVQALRTHYLSPSLSINLPTTVPYEDRDVAIAAGEVDVRTAIKIDVGSTDILSLSKIKSANAYLQRRFVAEVDDGVLDGRVLKWNRWWDSGFQVQVKELSPRTKLDAVDDLMMPIFEDLLGIAPNGLVEDILREALCGSRLISRFVDVVTGNVSDHDECLQVLNDVRDVVTATESRVFDTRVCPVAFYVGSTGLIPDEYGAQALDIDQLTERYPSLKVGKAERSGTFFVIGDTILTVYMQDEYYSTGSSNG